MVLSKKYESNAISVSQLKQCICLNCSFRAKKRF